jgi:hypothetical protein
MRPAGLVRCSDLNANPERVYDALQRAFFDLPHRPDSKVFPPWRVTRLH